MEPSRLDPGAVKKVSGPAWELLRQPFLDISRALLDISPDARGQLTTTYVKYEFPFSGRWVVYSVVWLKRSSELVVGMALPGTIRSGQLHSAPPGMTYAGLTSYFTVRRGGRPPSKMSAWARQAFESARRNASSP